MLVCMLVELIEQAELVELAGLVLQAIQVGSIVLVVALKELYQSLSQMLNLMKEMY